MGSPPLEPPWMMSLLGEVCWLEMRCSAQAAKSSNTFCLLCREPALRQSMPYSPPPLHAIDHGASSPANRANKACCGSSSWATSADAWCCKATCTPEVLQELASSEEHGHRKLSSWT